MRNHLGARHQLVNASQHKIQVGGVGASSTDEVGPTYVYGMWFDPGYGYHVDFTKGIATGNEPESIYAVMSGSRQQLGKGCCFDYGNSENSVYAKNKSMGAGAMEAIYFGNTHWMGNTGDNSSVDGPWVGADLEAGMYYGGGPQTKVNPQNKPLTHPFVSLYLRGGTNGFALKGGDATSGTLTVRTVRQTGVFPSTFWGSFFWGGFISCHLQCVMLLQKCAVYYGSSISTLFFLCLRFHIHVLIGSLVIDSANDPLLFIHVS